MHLWQVVFTDRSYGYVEGGDIVDAAKQICLQNWNQSYVDVAEMSIAQLEHGGIVRKGWHSET